MDLICSTKFWDGNITWGSSPPLFTPCFMKVGLIWGPVAFFWVFAPLEIYYINRQKEKKIQWTALIISKLVGIFSLMVLTLADMVYQMVRFTRGDAYPVEYFTPFLLFTTLVASALMCIVQRRKGCITSGVQFFFYLLLCIGTGGGFYTSLQKIFNEDFAYDLSFECYQFVMCVLYFAFSFILFVLNCFADCRVHPTQVPQRENPEERASFLSLLTFNWFNPMAVLGYKKPLTAEDMWKLKEENWSETLQARFDKYWQPLVEEVKRHHSQVKRSLSAQYSEKAGDVVAFSTGVQNSPNLSILNPILKTFGCDLFCAGLLKVGTSAITFANPLLLDHLITFVGNEDPYWKGVCFASAMVLASVAESFLSGQYEYKIYTVAMQIRSCIISALYRKALMLSTSGRKDFTAGEIVNLMSVDTQRIMDYVQIANLLWSAPLQIAIAIYFLWKQLGVATLGGLGVMILMIPLNGVISVFIKKFQVRLMKHKDLRTKLMNEILNGMKVLKLYAWEPSFLRQMQDIRSLEVGCLRAQAYLNAVVSFVFSSAPFLVSLASFASFVLMDSDNLLDANKAFVSLSLFNILRIPTALLPMIITFTAMFVVSLRRVNKFLQGDEIDPEDIQREPSEKDPVVMENGTFSWTKEEFPVLRELRFRVPQGTLVAIVGQVGAGKSSLLSALLGDMVKWKGKVNIQGSVAYVPQQAWIQNTTLRKNIVFTHPFEEKHYSSVLEACALTQDLGILPARDMTEIGEKGINLSGGQKQRVNLARAVYSDADIYYLDDPLSAVDAHVGKHIFREVLGPQGLLKNKTRILVTHKLGVLPFVDSIVVLKDGRVSEEGTYKELLARKGAFADFLIEHLRENVVQGEDDFQLIQEIAATVGALPEITRQLSNISINGNDSGSLSNKERSSSIHSILAAGEGHCTPPKRDTLVANLTEQEAMQVGSVKSSVYLEYIRNYGYWNTFLTLVLNTVCTGLALGSNLWLSAWSGDALDPSRTGDKSLRDVRLEVYSALGAGEIVSTLVNSVVMNLACLRAARVLHDGMLERVLRTSTTFLDTTPLGRIFNRFTKDVDTADVTIRFNIRMLIMMVFRTLAAFVVISLETSFFLLACIPLTLLYYFLQKLYIPTSRQLKRLESTTRSPIYSHFSETVAGSSCIRAYAAQQHFAAHSDHLVDLNNESYYSSLGASRWLSIRLEFLGYNIVFLAALFAVFSRDTLSPGIAGLCISYALQITGVLNMLVRATADVETNMVAVERCLEYTKVPVEAEWRRDPPPAPSWPQEGAISFENYAVRYREGLDLVLKNITCKIDPKERCGVVGRTGAGKSSLTLALFRIMEPAAGRILIDELDISTLGLHDLRSKITIIPQDPVLFTGTLRSNLDPCSSYDDSTLWLSVEQAHLKEFVSSLEKGLDHPVTEGGENLSVGQRQLICLARALLRKSKILVLDEATSAIDMETDRLVQSTIRTEFQDCTVLTVAHRLDTILDYDKVIVLSEGRILEMDKPQNLLKEEKSAFYLMAKDGGLL